MGPAAPMRTTEAHEDTTIGGGKYTVKKGQPIAILTMQALRDPKVWGEDVSAHCLRPGARRQAADIHPAGGGVQARADDGRQIRGAARTSSLLALAPSQQP